MKAEKLAVALNQSYAKSSLGKHVQIFNSKLAHMHALKYTFSQRTPVISQPESFLLIGE